MEPKIIANRHPPVKQMVNQQQKTTILKTIKLAIIYFVNRIRLVIITTILQNPNRLRSARPVNVHQLYLEKYRNSDISKVHQRTNLRTLKTFGILAVKYQANVMVSMLIISVSLSHYLELVEK